MPMFVCLSVCLLARLLKNACLHLDEMWHVERCWDMDELINFRAGPDHSPDAGTGLSHNRTVYVRGVKSEAQLAVNVL